MIRHLFVAMSSFSGGSSANQSNSEKSLCSNPPSREIVQQIRVKLNMKVPAIWDHSRLRYLFVDTYKNEQFRMTLHKNGTSNWRLEGSVRFNKECKLINARARLKRVLMECQAGLVLSSAETRAFRDYV